jgi:hypothetical protein
MPSCRLCAAHFPNRLPVEGKLRNLSNRQYCLVCSPWGGHNVRKLEQPARPRDVSKICPNCGQFKPIDEFYLRPDGERSHSWCKVCNIEHRKARFRDDRLAALRHYGNGDIRCDCCGERQIEFLGLDHINNDGAAHRRAIGYGGRPLYSWLRKTSYTYVGLVVACHNCNMARAMYGICPHKRTP